MIHKKYQHLEADSILNERGKIEMKGKKQGAQTGNKIEDWNENILVISEKESYSSGGSIVDSTRLEK